MRVRSLLDPFKFNLHKLVKHLIKSVIPPITLLCSALAASADWRYEVGYTRLALLAGNTLPSVSSNGFTQVEAPFNEAGDYQPNTASSLFVGKTFTSKSGTSAVSEHANSVASLFYGNPSSLVTGNCPIDLYEANSWLDSDFLNTGSNIVPATETHAVANHSWIAPLANGVTDSVATTVGRRLDFAINRDGFVCVVGVNNGNSTTLPQLLAQSYHTISVGLVNGDHSAGFTTLDGSGRIKPDIVAPENFTSFTTPMVSSAAGLLYSKLSGDFSLTGADLPRVIKALLLASATKDTVASWANTSTRPLDLRYGAGELNVNHAYNDLLAGRATASATVPCNARGWAAESLNSSTPKIYYFTISAGAPSTPFCAALTWHRVVNKMAGDNWSSSLADLNLHLYHASGTTLGTPVSDSQSSVDNVELIYQSALPPGDYALKVENSSGASTAYGLAWHSLPAVTIATTTSTAREIDGQQGLVTINRTGDTNFPLLVPLTVGGTALSGSDFQPLPTSILIPAGSTSTTLQVAPVPDDLAEGTRNVTLAIAADFALVRDASQTATVTIEDKPFDNWRFAHFTTTELGNPAISSVTADPDGDTLGNLIEYALNLDPHTPDASPLIISSSSGHLDLLATKNPSATDILWNAEASGDLVNWPSAVITTNNSTTFEAHDPALTSSTDRRFIRLKIQRP